MITAESPFFHKITLFYGLSVITIFLMGLISPRLIAYLPAIVGLSIFLCPYFANKEIFHFDKKNILLFSLITGLAFISAIWAPDQNFALERSTKIALILMFGLLFIGMSRNITIPNNIHFLIALIAIHIIASIFFISELHTAHAITKYVLNTDETIKLAKYNRSHIVFAFLTFIILFLTSKIQTKQKKKYIIYAIVFISACAAFYTSKSQTAQLTFLSGLFFMFLFPTNNNKIFKLLSVLILAFIVLFPFTVNYLSSILPEEAFKKGFLREANIITRADVWNHSVQKTLESPIYGHGIESVRFMKSNEWMKHHNDNIVLHSHNSVLQTWVEFGAIGVFLGLIFIGYFLKKIYKILDPTKKRFCLTIFMACFICSLTGYGMWQSWQIGMFIFMAGLSMSITNTYNDLGNKNQ